MTALLIFLLMVFSIWLLGTLNAGANWGGWQVNWIDGLTRLLCRFMHRLPPQKIPLPETGAAIVVANHTSGLDPLLLVSASHRPLRFLIAREHYEQVGMRWLYKKAGCIPVDRSGHPEAALRQALRALAEDEVIAIFPHGTIHLDSDPPRRLKAGFSRLAQWAAVPVFPVRIEGVGAQGKVLAAPFVPSKVRLTFSTALHADAAQPQALSENVRAFIERRNIRETSG